MSRSPEYEIRVLAFDAPGKPFLAHGTTYGAAVIRYTENFYGSGSFEISMPVGAPCANAFQKNRFVQIGRYFYGVIHGVQYQAQADGDMLTVTGQDLLGLLSQRITVPPDFAGTTVAAGFDGVTGNTETVIKHFVANNVVNPLSTPRRIPGFVVAPNQGRGLPEDKYLSRFDVLSDVVGMVGRDAKLGLSCVLDVTGGRIVFDVIQGTDRTAGQEQNHRAIFNINRGTVLGMTHTDSDAGLRNAFYSTMAGAEFEDEALTMVYYRTADETDPPEGIFRREMHMDVSAEHPTPGQEYAELKRLSLINATNYERLLSFTCDVNFARIAYRKDYFLGDLVTVQNLDWGVTMDIQLVGMTTEHTGSGSSYTATFGEQKPGMIRAIKKAIKMG